MHIFSRNDNCHNFKIFTDIKQGNSNVAIIVVVV